MTVTKTNSDLVRFLLNTDHTPSRPISTCDRGRWTVELKLAFCHTQWTCSIMTQWLAVILHDDTDSVETPRLDILLLHWLERFAAAIRMLYLPFSNVGIVAYCSIKVYDRVYIYVITNLNVGVDVSSNIPWQFSVTLKVRTRFFVWKKQNLKMAIRRLMSMIVVMRA